MHDERMIIRSTLGSENSCDRLFLRGVGCESINGFRRQTNQPTITQDLYRAINIGSDETVTQEGDASKKPKAASKKSKFSVVAK
jgi:hypothetical protein